MEIRTGFARLLLLVLLGWTALGAIGVTISFRRGERSQGRRNLAWIAAIWVIYLCVLVTVSLTARPRVISAGQEQCFNSLCFAVVRSESVPGYLAAHGERIVRLYIRVTNRSGKRNPGDRHLDLYLVDSQGRRWEQAPGVEGVPVSIAVPAKGTVVSAPVFKVAHDAEGLRLVASHGHRLPYLLMVGDPDSILHPPVSFSLPL